MIGEDVSGAIIALTRRGMDFIAPSSKTVLKQNILASKTAGYDDAKHPSQVFTLRIEEKSAWSLFEVGNILAIDVKRIPKSGDYVIAWFPPKQKFVIAKYRESTNFYYLDMGWNDLVSETREHEDSRFIGVISELRKYF